MNLREINEMRKKSLNIQILVFTAIVLLFLGMAYSMFSMGVAVFPLMIIAFVVVVILVIYSSKFTAPYVAKYKEWLRKEAIEEYFTVNEYFPDSGFSKDMVSSTYLAPMGDVFKSSDLLVGDYNGCKFERCELLIQDETSDGETTTTTTLFSGSWTIIEYPKSISSYLYISERKWFSSNPEGLFSAVLKTSKVKFESASFNEKFTVYAEDEKEAFYIVNPVFMEKLTELEQRVEGDMVIGFIDNKIHILFGNRDNVFTPNIFREVTEGDLVQVRNEMQIIVDIIELLKLNDN